MTSHLTLLTALLSTAGCVVLDRCSLARELSRRHLIPRQDVATWVCIARHESDFNTSAVGHMDGESGDHGIFQISDRYWCSPPGVGTSCGLDCALLEDDDLSDDVSCALRIHQEHERLSGDGFTAWVVYRRFCLGDVSEYVRGCEDNLEATLRPSLTTLSDDGAKWSSQYNPTTSRPAVKTTLANNREIYNSAISSSPSLLKTSLFNNRGTHYPTHPTIASSSFSTPPSLKTTNFNNREALSTYPTFTTTLSTTPRWKTWYKDRKKYTYKSTYTSLPLKTDKIPRGKKLSEYSDSSSRENDGSTSAQSRSSETGLARRPNDLYTKRDLDPRTAWYRIHYDPRFLDEFP